MPAARGRVPAAARVPHLLEDLGAVGPARRLRGRLARRHRPARGACARARRERPHPGRPGAGAEDRRPRDPAPP
jgi:hypothetical protein